MTNRIRIQAAISAFKVSLPGVDVDSATLDQLCFDAAFGTVFPFASGFVGVTPAQSGAPGGVNVGYPMGLPTPPLCFYTISAQGGLFWARSNLPAEAQQRVSATITTVSVNFYHWGGGSGTHACWYTLLRQAI